MSDSSVSAANFAFVAELLRKQCGLALGPGKEYLVSARLTPLVHNCGMSSVDHLIDRLKKTDDDALISEVVEAMVTTETFFFRDVHPFEMLRTTVLPELIERRRHSRNLNIWCAAGSSGQEPYSIAMLIKESFPDLGNWRVNIAATDISLAMLQRCRLGSYSQLEVNRGLPTGLLLKWFRQAGSQWHIDDCIRNTVTFSQLNLIHAWPAMPQWDLVFLRNVLIYFDNETKRSLLDRTARVLCGDGYLVLGSAETTFNLCDAFCRVESLKSGFYQLRR